MKSLAILIFLIGAMSMLVDKSLKQDTRQIPQEQAIALNFVIYRNAVLKHAFDNKGISGTILQKDLDTTLPDGFQTVRTWNARIIGDTCFIWGLASAEEIIEARSLLQGSYAIGTVQNGFLYPDHDAKISVSGVPEGNLVSVVNVR